MPHISKRELTNKTKDLIRKRLIQLLESSKNKNELSICLDGLLTETERIMIGKRLMVSLLIQSNWNVLEITDFLNISSSTVYRLEQKIRLDENYRSLLKKLFPKPVPKLEKKNKGSIEQLLEDFFAGYRDRNKLKFSKD